MGYIFDFNISRKNVAFGLEERRLPQSEINKKVDETLELVGLQDYAERRPGQLSGGQQQRVALARTIIIEPKVLLLDEPLSNLDAKLRVHMRQELLELQRKLSLTTIFVTHDQEEANTTADRIAVLKDGEVQQIGAPIELYDSPQNLFVAEFLGMANILEGDIKIENNQALFAGGDGISIALNDTDVEGSRHIMFRPQNLTICEPTKDSTNLRGVVNKREFLGNLVRYEIGIGQQSIILDQVYGRGELPTEIGQQVAMTLDADHILVL